MAQALTDPLATIEVALLALSLLACSLPEGVLDGLCSKAGVPPPRSLGARAFCSPLVLPALPLLLRVSRHASSRPRSHGLLRFFGGLILVFIIVAIAILALIAYVIYRLLRRGR